MSVDIIDLEAFYASHLGRRVADEISQILKSQDMPQGLSSFGLGFTRPFLGEHIPTLMPAQQGTMVSSAQSVLIDEQLLPFRDNQLEHVVACHFLEHCADPLSALQEVYRVMVPEGRLQLIVANRRGIWSRRDRTPFGMGRPYSRGQIRRITQQVGFVPLRWENALHFLPSGSKVARYCAPMFDQLGRRLWPELAGLNIVTCVKRVPAPHRQPRQYVRFARPLIRPAVSRVKV